MHACPLYSCCLKRACCSKRKLQLAIAWIGVTADEAAEKTSAQFSNKLDMGKNKLPDIVIPGIRDPKASAIETKFEFAADHGQTEFSGPGRGMSAKLRYQPGSIKVAVDGKETTNFTAEDGTTVVLGRPAQLAQVVEVTTFGTQFYPPANYRDMIEGGDKPLSNQERMVRIFASAKQYQRAERLDGRLKDVESFFPERLRPLLYAWALQKDPESKAHLMELKCEFLRFASSCRALICT